MSELKNVEIGGRPLKCVVCDHDEFTEREALLNTAGLTLLGLDWANKPATCFVCDSCGYIHWFLLG